MIQKEFELLQYQFELLRKMVNADEHPFYDYLIDYNVTREQHKWIIDVLIVLSNRLKQTSGELDKRDKDYYKGIKNSFIEKYKYLKLDLTKIFSNEAPTFKEFEYCISVFLPNDVKPLILLKRMKKQGIYMEFCDYLLFQVQK